MTCDDIISLMTICVSMFSVSVMEYLRLSDLQRKRFILVLDSGAWEV
jgi:hypothetical protein